MRSPIEIGVTTTIHELANNGHDYVFKLENGIFEYEGTGYPQNASGRWVYISRFDEKKGFVSRIVRHDTRVIVLGINRQK